MMLMLIARIVMLKMNDNTPWISVIRRMCRAITATSDTCDVMPMTQA